MKGFTVIELLVCLGVVITILTLVLPNMLTPQRRSAYAATITTLASDLREQQLKSMLRDGSVAISPSSYGVYFESSRYILFKGSVYSPAATDNFPIELDPQITFTAIGFPDSQIVFSQGDGQADNFSLGTYTITIQDTSEGISNVISVNRYGVASQIN